jgi:hypothetical protein
MSLEGSQEGDLKKHILSYFPPYRFLFTTKPNEVDSRLLSLF